ncbi:MAG: ATP-binding protein [Ignavibacterium sp.]|nr:ATP-binding protein [Ignavibacterium sp.]MCX7610105.1 ATP-binding protein [Ignavibacterium sp.]MDW8375830.1 ATP-binding protein [Ignavibacteriales bacterium]
MIIERQITSHIRKMLDKFPIVSINGPRQSGKTTLLREFFQEYKYYNLERLDLRQMIMSDPIGFLNSAGDKVIFDEAQNLPELFSYIQVISDERKINGQFILSGSQSFLLNEKISQSLAGRVNINILLPFDLTEIKNYLSSDYLQLMYNGFYPRILINQIDPQDYYPSYLQTYIERDIRTLKAIENLHTFTKFLIICAGRVGQVINLTSLANDTGISVNTVKSWLSLLEASFIIFFLKPYHNNFNKRIIKAPKLYFYDTGLICSLLRIPNKESIRNFPLYGALFENFVIGDLVKQIYHSGKQPNLFYYKESNGKEIDCIIEKSFDEIIALEIKGGETFNRDYLINFKAIFKNSSNLKVHKYLIHPKANKTTLDDIKIIDWIDAPSIFF